MKIPEGIYRRWYINKRTTQKKYTKFYWMRYNCKVGCVDHPEGKKQHEESTGKTTVNEAKVCRDIRIGKVAEGKPVNGSEILVGSLLQGVIDYAATEKCRTSTAREYDD